MNSRYALPAEPRAPFVGVEGVWNRGELVVSVALYLVGALGLGAAWYGSGGEADWHDTAGWFVLATASVTLAGLGILVWLALGKLRIAAARRAVTVALADRHRERPAAIEVDAAFVTAAGMRRFHRPVCLLMAGKEPVVVDAASTTLRACGVCAE